MVIKCVWSTGADLTFCTTVDLSGIQTDANTSSATTAGRSKIINIDLKDDGEHIDVTEENKQEYVELMLIWLCRQR